MEIVWYPNHMKTNASKEKLDRRLELQFSKKYKCPIKTNVQWNSTIKKKKLNNKNYKLNVIFLVYQISKDQNKIDHI